ncbi:MAG: hypothetical protein IPK69_10775 [Phycisphaerales bacterium]|nr:MAG: hypothetical protein IPK69_10775 [Phycisphaerales bacterium]
MSRSPVHRPRLQHIAFGVTLALSSGAVLAQSWFWPPESVQIERQCVGPSNISLRITASGQWPDSCTPSGVAEVQASPGRVDVIVQHGYQAGTGCLAVISSWSRDIFIQIPRDNAEVYVSLSSEMGISQPPVLVGTIQALEPGEIPVICCNGTCATDIDDGSGTGTPDGGVTIDDLLYYIQLFREGSSLADVTDDGLQCHGDGAVTIDDLLWYINALHGSC